MRDNRREQPYFRDYNNQYGQDQEYRQQDGRFPERRNDRFDENRRESDYRMQQRGAEGRRGDYQGTQEDYYRATYDISNYEGSPRAYDYGLPNGPDDDLDDLRQFPLDEGPYANRPRYSYRQGYNANYDNPEEGDRYRDFDSRGNHGYRHDPGHGYSDEFREFGDDHYGRPDESGGMNYSYFGGYNR